MAAAYSDQLSHLFLIDWLAGLPQAGIAQV